MDSQRGSNAVGFVTVLLFIGGLMVVLGTGLTDKVKRIAQAIASAEGFYVNGSVPQRANNPGDLKNGDKGYGTIGGKTVYASVDDGWSALYKQVTLMLTGLSKYYKPSMSIQEIAVIYTGADAADSWAAHAAQHLGVSPSTTLSEVV